MFRAIRASFVRGTASKEAIVAAARLLLTPRTREIIQDSAIDRPTTTVVSCEYEVRDTDVWHGTLTVGFALTRTSFGPAPQHGHSHNATWPLQTKKDPGSNGR